MGVEDWETRYKLDDNLLDDYLEPEQKMWDDDDETKSEIYRIVNNPSDSNRSCFYQAVECEATSPEANEHEEAENSVASPGEGSSDVRPVYKEAGSFEDETSPPEVDIIPTVRKLHQQTADQEACKDSLLYKTRMWAKTHIQDILENYAIYREKEEARMRARREYESVGSDDVHFSLGSEEDLEVMAFMEEDTQCEYDSYYNSRNYITSYSERPHSYYELRGSVSPRVLDDVSPVMGPCDDYIDTMNELQKIVDTVTEYLAGREEEISKYEEMHESDNKSMMVDKEKDKDVKSDETKEETAVEHGITEVKNAVNSLFNTLVGTKSTGETTDTTATTTTTTTTMTPTTTTTCSLPPESGISKLLSFIPKSNGSPTPVAVVPPAQQELSADKKSPLQSLLPLQSSETSHPASVEGADDTANVATSPENQGSTASQSQSVVDSVLGRLSPFRIFGDKSAGEATSQPETPNKSHGSTESKEGLTDKATLSIEQSASQPEHQTSCGGSCSGSVELLPETESSGEIPDAPAREMTPKPEEQKTVDDTGFFSPFKKSLTSFMTTTQAPVNKTSESPSGNSVFSIFKPAEALKPEDAPATIGDKLKLSFFSSDSPSTPQAPKQESGLLSGLLKLGPGEDATTSKQGVSNTSAKSPLLSRAMLLESVPKGNTDTGWFSNLFKMSPAESPKPQTVAKPTTTNIPTVVVAPEVVEESIIVSKDVSQEEQMPQEDATLKSETDIHPESLADTENEECVNKTETQADPSELQDQAQSKEETVSKPESPLTVLSGHNNTSDKPQEGGLLSTLFSSLTSTTNENRAQQGAIHQSTGLFSGILKMAATENAGTCNEPAGAQLQPVKSESHLGSTSPAGVQKQSQEQKPTLQKSFLAGLFSKGSEEDSSSKLKDATVSHTNNQKNSSVGKDLLSGILKSESNESSRTAISKDSASTDTAALPQSGGLLSGLFKLASDTVSSSPATPAQQISQPLLKSATAQGSNQPLPQTTTPPSHQGSLLSGLFKLPGAENGTGNEVPDQHLEQPGNYGGQQPNHKQPNTQSNAPPVQPQSGGLFGGLLKLTESAFAPSSTQQPSGTSSQPNQQSTEPSPKGEMLSGFKSTISVAESAPQQSHLPAASQDSKLSQQSASVEKGGFLTGLFGISTSEANTGNQVTPQNDNSQQFNKQNLAPGQETQPSGRAGILSGLFNKIVDTSSQSVQSDSNQNSAQQPSPSLLSGLFSTNRPPAQQQKSPSGTQMILQQQQQCNRQPLQRQDQIPVQPAAAPEPQQRGLFSGLFNKLTSTDTAPQQPVAEGSPSPQACRSGHPMQDHQSPPASQVETEVFKTSTVTTVSKKIFAEQQKASTGLHQKSNRQDHQAPKTLPPLGAVQPQSQPGGHLTSIFKVSRSEELQQEQTQSNTHTTIKSEAQDCDGQERGIMSGFFSKMSKKAEDKSDSHIPSGQKPQQHEERKPVQNRPQIQRAKPITQESTQDRGNEKDQGAPLQKGFLAGLFSKESEDNILSKLKETNESKSESSENTKATITKESEKSFIDQLLHKQNIEEGSSVASVSGSKTSTQIQEPLTLHPAVKSTQQYLEEVHRLLYGTATEYGYQDLLYLFAEHGIVPTELYEHQCLIEALLWQQLNDYAILETLEAQGQEYYAGFQEDASTNSHETVMQEPGWWNLKNMDPRQFHIPSYPWQDVVSSSFPKRLPQAHAEDDIVFDMSVKNRKLWGSCDNMDHFSNQTSRNHWIEKGSTGTPTKLTRCQSLFDCSKFGKPVKNDTLNPQFDTSKFIKRLTVKKGPMDLTVGAVDLSSFSATASNIEDDMFFEDSEWYQQWLSLLEQGMWWPAESGDCGYYIYADDDYIYSLLTDRSGKHLYAYSTKEKICDLEEIAENISNFLQNKNKPKTTLCGFKIPLFDEDEMLWVKCHSHRSASSCPVDLSSAFEKGDRIMNMNLERFSEMLQDSIIGQTEHPVDLSVYKLQKIEVKKDEPKGIHPREQIEASDLTSNIKKVNNGGPYWKNQGINDLFPGHLVAGVSDNISLKTSSVTSISNFHQNSSIRCHPPTPEIKIRTEEEADKKVLLNNFGDKTKDAESSKIIVISNTANSNSKIVPQNQHAQRKLPDAPVYSKASTNSTRSLPATPRNTVTEGSIVTTTSSQRTLLSPQRLASSSQCSSGSSSSAVSHRPQLGRQSSMSTQSLKMCRAEGVQRSTCPTLPQPPKVATYQETRPLPPPQNLLYNKPKQALDSLLRSKPLDFSESLRNKVNCPGWNTTLPVPDLSNDDIIIEDILDFTKNRLKKVRKIHQWTSQTDTNGDIGIDLTVEIKEESKEINLTFPALEFTKPFPFIPDVPLKTVSTSPSPKLYPPDSEPSSSMYRTDQCSSSSPSIGSKLVRQVPVQCLNVSTTPDISGRKSISTSPKLSTKVPGPKTDCGKDKKVTHQGTSSSQPTSPEIKKFSETNLRSQITQILSQPSSLNESIIPAPPQLCSKSTAPANLVRNTLDMSSAPVVGPLDKTSAETQVVPLVRSRRTSVAGIDDCFFGVPLIVDSSVVQAKQQKTMTGEVPPSKSNIKASQVSPVLCRQQPAYNLNRDSPAHFSQSCRNVSAPANSIKTTLDMSIKPAEGTVVSSDGAVSLVRRRSRSTSGIIEELGGISLVVEPLTTKVKPPIRRFQSQDTILKPTRQMVNLSSQIKSFTKHQTTLYSLAVKRTVTTPANSLKATFDISANLVPKTTEGTVISYIKMLPDVGKVKNVLGRSDELVGSSIIQHSTPEIKPLLRNYQAVEAISQNSSQNAKENKTPSGLTPENMVKPSRDISLKPAGNISSSEVVSLMKNKPVFNVTGPALGLASDMSLKDSNQTKHTGMVKLVKRNSSSYNQALQMSDGVPSMVNTSEQHRKLATLSSNSPSAQLANIPSAPANSIKNTLDMTLRTAIKEPDKAAGRILEISPGKVMPLVQTKNVVSTKDLVGMPLIVKAISAPEQLSYKELQAQKKFTNGHETTETHLCVQAATYHSDRLFYSTLKQNRELQAQTKPMDFSISVSNSPCNDLSNMHDGQLMDFSKTKEVILRNKQKHQQKLGTTTPKNHTAIIDLTVTLDAKTEISGVKDLSIPTNSFLPDQYALTSLAMDQALICSTAQYTFKDLRTKEPQVTQPQITYSAVQPATPITSTNIRRTKENLENNFNMPGLQILPEPVAVFSVEQKKSTESSHPWAQLTNNNLCHEKCVITDGPPILRAVTNSSKVLGVEQSTLSTSQTQHINSAQTQGSNITRHPLSIPRFMQHDSLITQVTEYNGPLEVSRSKGLIKQSTMESLRENTIQSWVPILNSTTYVPRVLNTGKASDLTSVVTSVAGREMSSLASHGQQCNNVSHIVTALSTDITPCTIKQAGGHDMSQDDVISEVSLAQSGSTFTSSHAEPEKTSFLAINTALKPQISSRQTLHESENTTRSVEGLISNFDGTASTASEDHIRQRSERIQQRTGPNYRSVPDQQMTPVPSHPINSAEITSVKRLDSMSVEDTSSTTPTNMVHSSMENPPTMLPASLACTAVPFMTACTVKTMTTPAYTVPPPLESILAVPHSSAAHISEASVTYCSEKSLSNSICFASNSTGLSLSSPLSSPGYTAPPPVEFPPAMPLMNAAHTEEPSVPYSPDNIISSSGYVATTAIRLSAPLPLPSPGNTAPTPIEFSPCSMDPVESKSYHSTELPPLSLHPPSLVHKEEPCTSVEPPVSTPVETLTCSAHVVPLPMEPPPVAIVPSTEYIASAPIEFSFPMLQNISHTAQPPTVSSNDKQCASLTRGNVLDRTNSPLLQSKKSVYYQSNKSRQVSKAPTIIITEVSEFQEPSSVMLAQSEIPEKEADLMISDTSKNAKWNKSTSVVTDNNIHITHMSQQVIPPDDHHETCSQSSNSQVDISKDMHTDSNIVSQKQSNVGAISSGMLFVEEVPTFATVLPTEVKEKTLCFTRLRSRQMLIPHITLKHAEEGCPSDEQPVSLHGTGDYACVSVTEDTKQHSIMFITNEAAVSVPEEHSSRVDDNQVDSSTIIIPVASSEVSESDINVSANTLTSLTPKFPNTEEQVSHSLLVQNTTSHKKELSSVGKDESMLIKSGNVSVSQNKDISSFELTPITVDVTSLELVKSSEDAEEMSELEHQKLSPETSEIAKPIKEEDAEVSAFSIKEPLFHNEEHLTSESLKITGPSDSSEISNISKEGAEGAEAHVLNTDELSMESTLPPTAVPEEQSGKVVFSLFGGSSCAPSQSQSGSSTLGGILSGASTSKETIGTSLFSMFGGASHQQTQASSAPKEVPGKKLFSMFSGSNVQQPLASCGPSGLSPRGPPVFDTREQVMSSPVGPPRHDYSEGPVPGLRSASGPGQRGSSTVGLPPRGQQSKESPGKGLFSMFTGPLTQQTLSSGASPRPPASGAPNLVGNLPGSSTRKDNAGSGLFSMFGGSSAQSLPMQAVNKCSNTEPAGKGLFSRFGGTESTESESIFKVPSVFSLGGGSEKQKLSGFGLLSFMDDKKTAEPILEDKTTAKLEDIANKSTAVNGEIKHVKSSFVKPDKSEQDLPNNSVSTANESYENVSTKIEIKSAYAVLHPEDGKIPEDKTTVTSEVSHVEITEESETEIKTVEHSREEKQQSSETEKADESVNVFQSREDDVIPEDKTLAAFKFTHAQITEKSETEVKTEEHPTEGQPQKQESLEIEKPLDSEQNNTKEQESDTCKETGVHTYFVESLEAEKSENSLESEKTIETEETMEAQIPQKLNKPVDYVSHTQTGEMPGTLEESQTKELEDSKIFSEIDVIPKKLEKSLDREETQNQEDSEKEANHKEQPKKDPFDGVIEKEAAQVKKVEAAEKQLTDISAQKVSEPLPAVVIQPQPLPEMIGYPHKPKPRMIEPPDHQRLDRQGHHRPSMTSFQKPSESAAFSGFMSMFSGPSASSKPATSSFFTSPQHSFFKLQSTAATSAPQQHKTSFFNLPTNLPAGLNTESIKGDLFGLLKSKDAARPEETKSAVESCKLKTEDYEGAKNLNKPRSSTSKESSPGRDPEAVALEQEIEKDCGRSNVEHVEESRGGNIETTDVSIKCEESEVGVIEEDSTMVVTSPIPIDSEVAHEKQPSSPTAKSMFDLSGLSAPPFGGLLSGAAETAKPFSSLFGSSTDTKVPQQPPDSGGLFASFKGFSAGPEPMSAPSMFGKKLGFPWQNTAPSPTPSTVVATQVESKNDNEEPEIEILSVDSDITESPDSSDTEGPTDTNSDKQQSFDSSPESLLAVKHDMSRPAEDDDAEADPSPKEKNRDATDHAMGQLPESPLKNEHGRRLVAT